MAPRSCLAPLYSRRRDPDEVKRDGWRETGLLAVAADDPRLDSFERQFLVNLGTRLYGPRRGDGGSEGTPGAGHTGKAAAQPLDGKRANGCGKAEETGQ